MQEIWNIRDGNYLDIPGFDLIHNQRKKYTGGGVGFYIRENLNYEISDCFMQEKILECQTIKIKINDNLTYHFTNVYMGHLNKTESLNQLKRYLNKHKHLKSHYLMGDLNIDLLKNCQLTSDLENILIDYNFQANCNVPTRFDHKNGTLSATLIDNIFSNGLNQGVYRILTDPIADHLCLTVDLPINKKDLINQNKFKIIKKFQPNAIEKIKTELNEVNWQHMLGQKLNYNVDFLTNTFNDIVNKYTDIKKIKVTNKMENKWFSKGLQKSKIKLRKLHKKSITNPNTDNISKYKEYYKIYKSTLRQAKTTYYKTELGNAWGESRKLWNIINEMSGRLKKDTKAIHSIKGSKGQILTSHKLIADRFGYYFSNVGSEINKNFKTNEKYIDRLCKEKRECTLNLKCLGISHVNKIIKSLKSKYSSGNDEINNVLLKKVADEIARPLTYIVNQSISEQVYPDQWKISKVVCLYKKGNRDEVQNYRPISLQSVLSKILEKAVKYQTYRYLEDNNLLPNKQYGFRNKQGTNHLLFSLMNKLTYNNNKNLFTKIAMLDFSKAFDLCDHKILIAKLRYLGFSKGTCNWFKSYLKNRKMYCLVNGIKSRVYDTTLGVPQGSILGPLLFLCYTCDIESVTENYQCFADDTSLYASGKTEKEANDLLQSILIKFSRWVENNKLKLNWDKSKIMTINSNLTLPNINTLTTIKINNITLQNVLSYKLVGVTIDADMSWKTHVSDVSRKLKGILFHMNRIKKHTPVTIMLLIYNSLFQSNMTYGLPIWGKLTTTQNKQIEILQKKAIRIVYKQPYNSHTKPLFAKKDVLTYGSLYNYHSNLFARSIRINPPINIKSLLTDKPMPTGPLTRLQVKTDQVDIIKCNSVKLRNQCTYQIPLIWNELDCNIKDQTRNSFKKLLKKQLFETQT